MNCNCDFLSCLVVLETIFLLVCITALFLLWKEKVEREDSIRSLKRWRWNSVSGWVADNIEEVASLLRSLTSVDNQAVKNFLYNLNAAGDVEQRIIFMETFIRGLVTRSQIRPSTVNETVIEAVRALRVARGLVGLEISSEKQNEFLEKEIKKALDRAKGLLQEAVKVKQS